MIPYGRQDIQQEDIDAVVSTLQSDFLTQGPKVQEFEEKVAKKVGAKYAVAVSNATAALHIGAKALGVGPGSVVVTSPNTFVASSNCAIYLGAKPEFIDIDLTTFNMDMARLQERLEAGLRPKLVIPVHFSGLSCDMSKLHELSQKYGFHIMEDGSHAIGAKYRDKYVGNCLFSDLCVFSFHPVKIITTGEGGVLTTNSEDLYKKLLLLRSHGITRNESEMQGKSDGPWYYEQIDLGFNYRLPDILAALGTSQLGRLDSYVGRRRALAENYDRAFAQIPVLLQREPSHVRSSYHLYVIVLANKAKSHRIVFEELKARGIGVNLHYIPVYRQPYYRQFAFQPADFPQMERYYSGAISLPLFPGLTDAEQKHVISSVHEVLG